MDLRPYVEPKDRSWLEERISGGYGAGHLQARRGELIDVLTGDGLVAEGGDGPIGVVLWRVDRDGSTELTYLWAFAPGQGIGSTLVRRMLEAVSLPIWVVTTNDNIDALRFYQRLGFRLRDLQAGRGRRIPSRSEAVDPGRARRHSDPRRDRAGAGLAPFALGRLA